MPSKLTREDRIGERYDDEFNRRQLHDQEQAAGSSYASAGADQAEAFANDPANATKNIDETKQQEESNNEFGYDKSNQPSGSPSGVKAKLKKYGPSGGILGLIFGGFFGFGVLFSPALAVVHLKEVFTEDLNDSLSAMDIRSVHVMRAKVKDMGKGVCTGVKIRCGLRGMTNRQVRAFERAGITVDTDGKTVTRKNHVKGMTFTLSNGETREVKNIRELNRLLGDPNVRNQLRRAYNPLFYSTWDKTFGKVLTKWKTSKADKLRGNTPAEMDESLNSSTAGEESTLDTEANTANCAEGDAGADCRRENEERERQAQEGEEKARGGGGGARKVFGGALKGVGIIGAADAACTVYNTARAVEAGAKIIRARQLAQFSMVFLTFADQVKAGEATPEQAEYVGNKLTAIDTDRLIINETSGGTVNTETGEIQNAKEVENPSYGKNAFDSEGAKVAFYNDAPTLDSRASQYTVGGGLVGTLASVNDKINDVIPGTREQKRSTCKTIQHPITRGVSLVVGVVAAFFSGGGTAIASIGASVAISAALPLLEAYLKDMLAGETVSKDTKGVDAGNAIFSGTATLLGSGAQARGMKPADTSELQTYMAKTEQIQQEYIAMGIEDAKDTPFDIMNQYSFAGMFARKLMPAYTTGSSVSATILQGLPSLFSSTLSSALPTSKAVGDFNSERFSKCTDDGYKELGIDADIFCNVRYVMSPKELGMDTEEVYAYMESTGQIDEDHNVQDGSDYDNFLKNCVNREDGWGASSTENSSLGTECMEESEKMSNFRVYTMDRSIEEGMDEGPQSSASNSESASSTTGGSFRVASFNVRGAAHTDGNPPDPGEPNPPTETTTWKNRIKHSMSTITSNNVDVIAFQELEPPQRAYFDQHLTNYKRSTHGKESDSIMWNTDKFTLTDKGTWKTTYFEGAIDEPWVKLKDNTTGQETYFLSVHDPINRGKGSAQTRYKNALAHKALVERLKDDAPVVLVGDFNSGYTKGHGAGASSNATLAYCVLTKDGFMEDAYDLSLPRQAKCPNPPRNGQKDYIDHVYLTPGLQVTSFKEIAKGYTKNGSDHPTIIVDVTIPSSGDGSNNLPSKDGWVWPVPGVKQMGTLGYGKSGSKGVHKGIDIGISGGAALGKPVVAAHDGKVVYRGGESDACGAYVVIKATGTNYYAAYQHVANIKVQKDQTVTAGTPIAEIGRQGGSTCGSSGFYHLHFSIESIFSPSHPVSTYADRHPHGTIDPLSVLPR